MFRGVLLTILAATMAACGQKSPAAPTEPTRVIGLSGNLAFGNVPIGQPTTRTLTISNTGNSTMTVNYIFFVGGSRQSGGYSAGGFGAQIAPSTSLDVPVMFLPLEEAEYDTQLNVQSDATSGNRQVAVSGAGVR